MYTLKKPKQKTVPLEYIDTHIEMVNVLPVHPPILNFRVRVRVRFKIRFRVWDRFRVKVIVKDSFRVGTLGLWCGSLYRYRGVRGQIFPSKFSNL